LVVLAFLPAELHCDALTAMTPDEGASAILLEFSRECDRDSDINEHLPTLSQLASECQEVAEMGVRSVVSTWALLHGMLQLPAAGQVRMRG
jgi:hypothetical protein